MSLSLESIQEEYGSQSAVKALRSVLILINIKIGSGKYTIFCNDGILVLHYSNLGLNDLSFCNNTF